MNTQAIYADAGTPALPLHLLDRSGYDAWRAAQPAAVSAWLDAQAFQPVPGAIALLPGEAGIAGAVCGIGDALDPCSYAHAPLALPPGAWTPAAEPAAEALAALQLGWGLGSYRFDRYKAAPRVPARLRLAQLDERIHQGVVAARAEMEQSLVDRTTIGLRAVEELAATGQRLTQALRILD